MDKSKLIKVEQIDGKTVVFIGAIVEDSGKASPSGFVNAGQTAVSGLDATRFNISEPLSAKLSFYYKQPKPSVKKDRIVL